MFITHNIFLVGAFICEILAAIGIPTGGGNLMALGLAFFFLHLLLH